MAATPGTFVKVSSGAASSVTTGSITTANGDALLAECSTNNSGAVTFSDNKSNGNFTAIGTLLQNAALDEQTMAGLAGPAVLGGSGHTCTATVSGTHNLTLLFGNATPQAGTTLSLDTGSVGEVVDTATPYQVTSGTPAGTDNLWVTCMLPDDGTNPVTFNQPSGYTKQIEETDQGAFYGSAMATNAVSSGSAQTVAWSTANTTGPRTMKIVAIRSVASSAQAPQQFPLAMLLRNPKFMARMRQLFRAPLSDVTIGLTGVSGTGAVGTVGVTVDKALTGNAATGAVGTVGVSVAKSLTGNAATGAVGTVGVTVDKALTGTAGTGAAGTLGVSVTVALTGVQATGAVGTVTASQPLTGVAGTGGVGTVGVTVDKALAGNAATGAVGTLGPAVDKALSGVAGTGAVGTVTPNVTIGLTGVQATGAVGTVTPSVGSTVPITGVQATGAAGQPGVSVTIALTGVSATGQAGTVGPGVDRALSGNAATTAAGNFAVSVSKLLAGIFANGDVGSVTAPASNVASGGDAWGKKRKRQHQRILEAVALANAQVLAAEQVSQAEIPITQAQIAAVANDDDEEELLMLLLL